MIKYIRASEIASLAGMNPFESQERAIEEFRERVDRKRFHDELLERNEEPDWLVAKKLCQDERFKGIVNSATSTISKNTAELQKKKDVASESISKLSHKASEKEQQLVRDHITRKTNTDFGFKLEEKARVKWSELTGKEVNVDDDMYTKELLRIGNYRFHLRGKIDGLVDEFPPAILEIKCRTKQLFHSVRMYEKIQVQAYCFLLDCPKAYLVEVLRSSDGITMDWHEVVRDKQLWKEVCDKTMEALTPYFIETSKASDNTLHCVVEAKDQPISTSTS